MQLDETAVRPVVDHWSSTLSIAWTAVEKNKITQILMELSLQVTPHIVEDILLDPGRSQAYLLARTIARLEEWLFRASANLRAMLRIDDYDYISGYDSLGLRSGTLQEIADLPGIYPVLATNIGRFVSQRPSLTSMDRLIVINGVGPRRLEQLKQLAYLDSPIMGLVSMSLWQFMMSPGVETFLALLDKTDLSFFFGDQNTLPRRVAREDQNVFERFNAFVELVLEQTTRITSAVEGVLASDVNLWFNRHELRNRLLESAETADGGLLINEAYIEKAKLLINGAADSVSLMVFLATTGGGHGNSPGPLQLIEALEAAARRGVEVRVILDQDDGGEPYKSYFINKPLVDRFRNNAVKVKFDEDDTLLHSKVLIVDENKVIVGSHNWTRASFYNTHEISVFVENGSLAVGFRDRFDTLWRHLPDLH
jgi:hypothetical protein